MAPNFNGKPPVITPGSTVLVTGANGFIGSHIADQLIQAGYLVRGTTRDLAKSAWITEMFDKKYGKGKLEAVIVKDMADKGAFDEACLDVSGVVHVASDVTLSPDPHKVIPAVIDGAVNVAESAAKQSSIQRFVYTSSSMAMCMPQPDVEVTISTDDWNDAQVEAAWKPPPYEVARGFVVYAASKTQAEQALWKFAKEQKPRFVLNTVLPNMNFGEIFSDKQPAQTAAWVRDLYNGITDRVKHLPPQWMINVKDTARLHVAALLDPGVENERILAFAYPYNWNDILAVLRKIYPDKEFLPDFEEDSRDLGRLDNTRGAELLRAFGRPGYTGLEESIRENTAGI